MLQHLQFYLTYPVVVCYVQCPHSFKKSARVGCNALLDFMLMQISQVLLWHNIWNPIFPPMSLPCHSHVYTQCQSIASQNIRCLGHNDTFSRLHQIPSKCAYISIVTFETFATHSTRHFHTSPLSNLLPFGSDMGGTWIVYISFRYTITYD